MSHNSNLFGENSHRGKIPLMQNNDSSIGNISERKNPITFLLGSVNASLES